MLYGCIVGRRGLELRNVSASVELKNHREQWHATNCSRITVANRRSTTTDAHSVAGLLAFASLACKLGSVATDESTVSTTASSVSQIHAHIAAIWVQRAFF